MTRTQLFDTAFLKDATPGTPVGSPSGNRVTTDSREDVQGALFVALSGPHFDGHEFVLRALEAGAAGAVVSASWWGSRGDTEVDNVFVVPSPLLALQDLARARRERYPIPLVAITGSNGKTSTKEILANALHPLGNVLRTQGNRNNHIGVPLTLLELDADHGAAVVEMGLNHPGELRLLSGMARPQVAVITNVAPSHLEGLGTVEGVAKAKAEIVDGLEPGGTLVMPHDSPVLEAALTSYRGPRVTFGLEPAADVHPSDVELQGIRGTRVGLADGTEIHTHLMGMHVVSNLLAALAAARVLGVSPEQAKPGIEVLSPVLGRLYPRSAGGVLILDDVYNANPASLTAAVETAMAQEAPRAWAILGDMLELGEQAVSLHRDSGIEAARLHGLVLVGDLAAEIGRGAIAAGMPASRVMTAPDGESAAKTLAPHLASGDVVLIKASRGMALETAVETLMNTLEGLD